jgi:hypothetical protein
VRVTRLLEQARCEPIALLLRFALGSFDFIGFALKMPSRRLLALPPKPMERESHSVRLAAALHP